MEIKIGCDPEFFLRKNGELISAHGLIPGTKEEPHRHAFGAMQVDGMAVEFNTRPATSASEFSDLVSLNLQLIRSVLPERDGYTFDFSPVAEFGKEYIESQPMIAKQLGCEPDYNAYTEQPNPKPNADMPFRTASGHIHIGWTENENPTDPEHWEACVMLTKQLDASLGALFRFLDPDTKRRQLYGAPGAFRPKPYGVEYRVLSNVWLKSREMQELVFNVTMKATNDLLSGAQYYKDKNIEERLLLSDPRQVEHLACRFYDTIPHSIYEQIVQAYAVQYNAFKEAEKKVYKRIDEDWQANVVNELVGRAAGVAGNVPEDHFVPAANVNMGLLNPAVFDQWVNFNNNGVIRAPRRGRDGRFI